MKRSEIQGAIRKAKRALKNHHFYLPMFADWDLLEWKTHLSDAETIVKTMRGWDVTDFDSGDFKNYGAVLFTIRNGTLDGKLGCPYAEKIIVMEKGQKLPLHYHVSKTEDIINRGGGTLVIQVYNALPDGSVDTSGDVPVYTDGLLRTVPAGTRIAITPGNSMMIYPRLYHLFCAEDTDDCLIVGEVSSINDDHADNFFAEERGRFSQIVEDEPWQIPLVNEYERLRS